MTNEELLIEAIDNCGSVSELGRQIGVSKTTLSQIQNDKYPNPTHIYNKLRKKFGYLMNTTVMCPGLEHEIHREVCRKYAKAQRDGKSISGASFALASIKCPYCPINQEK